MYQPAFRAHFPNIVYRLALCVDQLIFVAHNLVAFFDAFITGHALTGVLGLEAHFMPFVAHVGCHSSSASSKVDRMWCGNGFV
ncbi:hypothetical protein A7R75_29960 [Mycolicibacterium llatzerense]|nr:hypothetical protein [Mycolicibacterium llatzerense]